MNREEIAHVLTAVLVFTIVLAFGKLLHGDYSYLGMAFVSAAVVIVTNIFGKKLTAHLLDSDVTHRIWFSNYLTTPSGPKKLNNAFPTGIVVPLFVALVTAGYVKISAMLEYESSAKKIRAAKRFGYYSYAEMTDWHNALIGAGGMIVTLVVLVLTYLTDFEPIAKAAAFYMFWNMVPISNTDGTQIFFGSKILWTVLALIAALSAVYAVALI